MLGTFVMFVLLVATVACLPNWWHSWRWGYVPSAMSGVLLVVAMTMVFADRL